MTRQLKFEDMPNFPMVKVTVIDTHDDDRAGVDELGSFMVTFEESIKLKAKSKSVLKSELDRENPPEIVKLLGVKLDG